MIKAKPTTYRGVTFRSKLEAEWAYFMDHHGIRWRYEPTSFVVTLGGYLPDFYLTDLSMWVEVKPGPLDNEAMMKIMDVCSMTGEAALLFEGPPKRKVRRVEFGGDMDAVERYKGMVVKSHVLVTGR